MRQIITSTLDNDLYKFTMLNAVLKLYPGHTVRYKFYDRSKTIKADLVIGELAKQVESMRYVVPKLTEMLYLRRTFSHIFDEDFFSYIEQFRFDPSQVFMYTGEDNSLEITIEGTWESTILWEVPLMAMISEIYFEVSNPLTSLSEFKKKTAAKGEILKTTGIHFMEFGTRRRFSKLTQSLAVSLLKISAKENFLGTSNIYMGMIHNVPVLGTVAHEWIMFHGALNNYKDANYFAIEAWRKVYGEELDVALTDTYGTEAFFKTVTQNLNAIRQDSGDPLAFTDKALEYFGKASRYKTILYSDGLNLRTIKSIELYKKGEIKKIYGVGTFFTNDIDKITPLNMVIKLDKVDKRSTVKLSDVKGKHTGDIEEINKCKKELGYDV